MCPFLLSHKHDRYSVYNSRQMYGNLRIYEHLLYYQINEISEKMLSICQGSCQVRFSTSINSHVKKSLKNFKEVSTFAEYN